MIPCYIPSKDRASQCHLLLSSLEQNAPEIFEPTVVYTHSNLDFAEGYYELQKKWICKLSNVGFEFEQNSEKQFYDFLKRNSGKLVCLFADDCIFYRPTVITEKYIEEIFKDEDQWTFTYRLGQNISIRDYVSNKPTDKPTNIAYNNWWYKWNWKTGDFWDISYFPVGFDGYIYRADDLLKLSNEESFGRICFWEKLICEKFRTNPPDKTFMAAPIHSEVFIQQINTVHEYGHRTNRQFNISAEELNKQWLAGNEIDLDSIDFSCVNCCHGELPFTFKEIR